MSKETELGTTVCAQIGVLGQFLQEKHSTLDYQAILNGIYVASDAVIEYNSDKFGQLSLLINWIKDAIGCGDIKGFLDFVAVEGERRNLGYGS